MVVMIMIVSYLVTMTRAMNGFGKIPMSNDLSISKVLIVESLNFNLLLATQKDLDSNGLSKRGFLVLCSNQPYVIWSSNAKERKNSVT